MTKNFKTYSLLVGAVLLGLMMSPVEGQSQNTMTLPTFYPAPSGEYDRIRLNPREEIVGACDVGTVYVNADQNYSLYYCRDDGFGGGEWAALGGVWSESLAGDDIFPTRIGDLGDSLDNIYVGIRRIDPVHGLDVSGAVATDNYLQIRNYQYQADLGGSDAGEFAQLFYRGDGGADFRADMSFILDDQTSFLIQDGVMGVGVDAPTNRMDIAGNLQIDNINPYIRFFNTDAGLSANERMFDIEANGGMLTFSSWDDAGATESDRLFINHLTGRVRVTETDILGHDFRALYRNNGDEAVVTSAGGTSEISITGDNEAILRFCDGTCEGFLSVGGGGGSNLSFNDTLYFDYLTGNAGVGINTPIHKWEVNGNMIAETYNHSSDERLKEEITPLDQKESLEKITHLNGYTFDWKKNGKSSIGIIAQEVEKEFPDAISKGNGSSDMMYVNYSSLIAPLIEATKEQQVQIDKLKTDLNDLKEQMRDSL